MKICYIGSVIFPGINNDESPNIGGIQGYVFNLMNYIKSAGFDITFVGKIFYFKETRGLKYYEIQKKLSSNNLFLIHLFLNSIKITIDNNSIVHAHRPDHLAAFTIFKKNKSIVTLHGQQAVTVFKRNGWIIRTIYSLLEKIALNKANYILVTDKITQNYYSKRYPQYKHKIAITPTCVDLNIFKPLNKDKIRKKLGYDDADRIILYLGRIGPPKRVADIIKSFSILKEEMSKVKLVIIGDGVQKNGMEKLTSKLSLSDSVSFLGARMRDELPELINAADISVLYSGNEGSPLSVKESLACGIPVVANRVGDIDEIIESGKNGYILDKENNYELSELMRKCLKESSSMKFECIESVKPYSDDLINKKVIDIYNNLIDL